jgi:hypothetical protein
MKELDMGHFVLPDGRHYMEKGMGDWSIRNLHSTETGEKFTFKELIFDPVIPDVVESKRYHRVVGVDWNIRYPYSKIEPKLHDIYVDISRCEELDLERPWFSEN